MDSFSSSAKWNCGWRLMWLTEEGECSNRTQGSQVRKLQELNTLYSQYPKFFTCGSVGPGVAHSHNSNQVAKQRNINWKLIESRHSMFGKSKEEVCGKFCQRAISQEVLRLWGNKHLLDSTVHFQMIRAASGQLLEKTWGSEETNSSPSTCLIWERSRGDLKVRGIYFKFWISVENIWTHFIRSAVRSFLQKTLRCIKVNWVDGLLS